MGTIHDSKYLMDFSLNEKSQSDIYIDGNFKSLWLGSFHFFAAYLRYELSYCPGLAEYLNCNKKECGDKATASCGAQPPLLI